MVELKLKLDGIWVLKLLLTLEVVDCGTEFGVWKLWNGRVVEPIAGMESVLTAVCSMLVPMPPSGENTLGGLDTVLIAEL